MDIGDLIVLGIRYLTTLFCKDVTALSAELFDKFSHSIGRIFDHKGRVDQLGRLGRYKDRKFHLLSLNFEKSTF